MSEFDFHMEHAAARLAAGEFDPAMRTYGEIAASADLLGKLEALCKMVELELELDEHAATPSAATVMMAAARQRSRRDFFMKCLPSHVGWPVPDRPKA